MEAKYYLKHGLGRMAAIESLGRSQPRWEQVEADAGVAAVMDPEAIKRLDECVKRGWGGVKSITQEEFEEKKSNPSQSHPRRKVSTHPETEKPRLMAERMFPQPQQSKLPAEDAQAEGGEGSSRDEKPPIATAATPTSGKVGSVGKKKSATPPPE